MATLYLVRHAHAEWQPSDARPLSARGHATALALADRVADELARAGRTDLAAIYSSPSTRALQTIEPLAARLGIQPVIVEDLRERELMVPTAGDFEATVEATWREPDRVFGPDRLSGRGESNATAQARGLAVVRDVLARHRDRGVLLSTHGNLLALVLNGFDSRYGFAFWKTLTFPDVYVLTFEDDRLMDVRRAWSDR